MSSTSLGTLPVAWKDWDQLRLETEIHFHNTRYWDEQNPTISDYDYDRLIERLKMLSPHSSVLSDLGPSIGLIGDPVQYERPMLSLDKCYDDVYLFKWAD
jgi:DNA ligase (NAD+)